MTVLDAAEITRYRREGWLKLPQLLSADEHDTLRATCLEAERRHLGGMSGESELPAEVKALFTFQTGDAYRNMFRNDHNLRFAFPELRPIIRKLGAIAAALIGTDDIRILWDKTFNKPPVAEQGIPTMWHQDQPYVPVDRRGFLSFWIPLEDVPEDSGPLRFLPGSHHLGSLGRRTFAAEDEEAALGRMLRPDDWDLLGAPVTVPVSARDGTVHDGLTIHGSLPNAGTTLRRVWSAVFVPADTLWTGGPFPHANFYQYGLVPFRPFDHPDLMVG